jgi:hypothetical protein
MFVMPAAVSRAEEASGSDSTGPIAALRSGWEHFNQQEYSAAVSAWQKSHEANPDDPRITFDLACAHSALEQFDEAIELYREVSLTRDWQLAAEALYNLGNIYVTKAKSALGAEPESAGPAERQAARNELTIAVDYFRECLRVNPDHAAARHNLETLRVWTRYIEATWRLRDRQQPFSSMTFAEILADIEKRQLQILDTTVDIEHQITPTPTGSQRRALVQQQDDVRADTEYLLQRATEEFAEADSESIAPLIDAVQSSAETMAQAHNRLANSDWSVATRDQRQAATALDRVYSATTSFPELVQKAIQEQSRYVELSQKASDNPQAISHRTPDHAAWQQQRITKWSRLLPELARLTQQQLSLESSSSPTPNSASEHAADASANDAPATDDTQPANPSSNTLRPLIDTITKSLGLGPNDRDETEKDQSTDSNQPLDPAALQPAIDLAIQLAPEITELSDKAANHLANASPSSALPLQTQALELLKKIAEQFPQQQEQQQDPSENQDQQQQSQDQQNQQQQQQSGSGEQDESQQSESNDTENSEQTQTQDPSQGDQSQNDKQEESGEDEQPQDEQQDGAKQPPAKKTQETGQEPPKSATGGKDDPAQQLASGGQADQTLNDSQQAAYSREQAMAILRRARQRAAEYREKERELQRRFARPPKTSKDW